MITVSTIAHATEIQLLCVTYELFLDDIKKAIESEGGQREKYLAEARETLIVLVENLNFEVPLAKDLLDLYIYIQNILINHNDADDKLEEVYKLIDTIYQGYTKVRAQEKVHVPAMANVHTVYAGMTYGKDSLNEYTAEDPSRGFKA